MLKVQLDKVCLSDCTNFSLYPYCFLGSTTYHPAAI